MSDGPRWWIGIVVAVGSNMLISLALNCQKLAHMQLHTAAASPASPPPLAPRARGTDERSPLLAAGGRGAAGDVYQAPPPLTPAYLRSKLWWTGFALMTLGESGNFLSYGFAPASLVAPLGAVSLLSNVVTAPMLLHETLAASDVVGVALAVAGAITVVSAAGPSTAPPFTPHELWAALERPAFVAYTCVMLALGLALVALCATRVGAHSVLAHVAVCAVFGAFTVLATKGISSFLVLGAAGGGRLLILREPLFFLLLVVLVGTAVFQLVYLNLALQQFDARHVIPVQFVLFTVSTIVGSAILYGDFEGVSWPRVAAFLVGCLGTFLGVLVLTSDFGGAGFGAEPADDVGEDELAGPVAAELARAPSADAGRRSVPIPRPPLEPLAVPRRSPTITLHPPGADPDAAHGGARTLSAMDMAARGVPRLADVAAAAATIVGQSQTYLRGTAPIRRTQSSDRIARAVQRKQRQRPHSHSVLPTVRQLGLVRAGASSGTSPALRAQPAFLGLSPGRNLLLAPSMPTGHPLEPPGGARGSDL
ncbi:hypothetical protein MSPP1_000562 [Malassezia sp. CBS 17886]|nr:hypothetical protein MSPP1_000562 [Malassezia sp. CBS 17886]